MRPGAPAIVTDTSTVTYAELKRRADNILARFYNAGYRHVGIVMSHGVDQIAAILAVLKSGAAYVPAEPFLPAARIEYMMRMAKVEMVITDRFCENLPSVTGRFADRSKPDGEAYILYTSGTSGKPKGVIQENHSVANYARAFYDEMKIGYGDVMLQYSVCSFDIFVEEVFATLLNGAALAIPSSAVHGGPLTGLMEFCQRHGVTVLDGFPYLIADINEQSHLLPKTVKLIVSGGDVLRGSYITNLRDKGIRIYNTYGPSETCVCSNYFRADNARVLPDGTFPVGKAIRGVQVKVLDKNYNEVPQGTVGEICIFGQGVNRGYLGNPPEQANFVTLADGTRFYRSGDLGYVMRDGNLAFLHRRDNQVMILGRRVEPDEVENVLNDCPDVQRGIVRAFADTAGLHYLTAYFVPRQGFSIRRIKQWLRDRLADFMVPEFFIEMSDIPLTRRGKVDMSALPVVMKEGAYSA